MTNINTETLILFDDITTADANAILNCLGAKTSKYKKNSFIFKPYDAGQYIGVVLDGKVTMTKEDSAGNYTFLTTFGTQEMFSDAFCGAKDEEHQIIFKASTDCDILVIPVNKVLNGCQTLCDFHSRIIQNMFQLIARENFKLINKLEILSQKNLREKILSYLYSICTQNNKYFEIPLGRQEFAEYLCVDRSSLTRELNRLKKDGMIDFDKNTFVIK